MSPSIGPDGARPAVEPAVEGSSMLAFNRLEKARQAAASEGRPGSPSEKPVNPTARPCPSFFGEGDCRIGDGCTFRHDTPISISVAKATFFTGKREEGALKPSELANILAYSKAVRAIVLDKATLCRAYEANGWCDYGMRCKHAHSEAELRNGPEITRFLVEHDIQPEHFKTKATRDKDKLCVKFDTRRGCKFADKCAFAHGLDDLRPSLEERRITRCQYDDEDGGCIDASCLYLHLTKSPDVGDLDYGLPLRPTFVRKRLRPPAVNTPASNPSLRLAAINSNEDDISPPASPTGTAQPVPTSETVRLPELSALSLFERA